MKTLHSTFARLWQPSAKALLIGATLIFAACGSDSVDDDNGGGTPTPTPTPSKSTSEVVKWMDTRLKNEYYWLDEYKEKHSTFDLTVEWDEFLDNTLLKMTTNLDDGSGTGKDRNLYTFITREEETKAATRAEEASVKGFGIELSPFLLKADDIEGYTNKCCFAIDHIYPSSPAAEAGLKRGDFILQFGGKSFSNKTNSDLETINSLWNAFVYNEGTEAKIVVYSYNEEAKEYETLDLTLTKASYAQNPVAFSDILEIPEEFNLSSDKKIGYLTYISFDSDYDQHLIDAIADLSSKGATDVILDLRINGGGHVDSSVLLASMLLDESYGTNEALYATLVHNPKNVVNPDNEECRLISKYTPKGGTKSDIPNLGIEHLWIICSELSASASEMVIVGLRGLDIDVTLIGNTTEGKNCGMKMTERSFDGYLYTFAPITFMNQDPKGSSDYGDGIKPDVAISERAEDKSLDESLRSECYYYPVPKTAWGDMVHDIALAEAVAQIHDKSFFDKSDAKALRMHQISTRSGGSAPKMVRTDVRMQREDLLHRGMILTEEGRANLKNLR